MSNQITRDIYVLRKSIIEPIHYVRLTNAVDIVFNMRDYDIPSGAVAAVYAQKPDGTAVYSNATISENTVTVEMTTQMVAVLGVGHLQVRIQSGSNSSDVLCSFIVPLIVEPNFTEGDFPPSKNENGFFGDVEEHLQQVESDMTTMKEEWTEFQSDITQQVQEIQEEQTTQGSEITDLQKKVAKLDEEKSPALVLDASGSWVTVEDSGNSAANGLTIHGKSTQVVTTGAQLFDKDAEIYFEYGNTVATPTDTGITVTGPWYVAYETNFPKNANIYVSFQASVNTRPIAFYKNKSFIETDRIVTIGSNGRGVFNTEDFEGIIAVFYAGNGTSGTTTYTNVMFNLGTAALPWEPYTGGAPSPSPDYPQEITSVGDSGSVEVVSMGENLLDLTADDITFDSCSLYDASSGAVKVNLNGRTFWCSVVIGEDSAKKIIKNAYNKKLCFRVDNNPEGKEIDIYIVGTNKNGETVTFLQRGYSSSEVSINILQELETISTFQLRFNRYEESDDPPIDTTTIITGLSLSYNNFIVPFSPYVSSSVTFQTPNGLPGIPVDSGGNYTDADGQQWICDEINTKTGAYIRRVGKITFAGESDENWGVSNLGSPNVRFYITINDVYNYTTNSINIICNRFPSKVSISEQSIYTVNKNIYILPLVSEVKDLNTWKTWLSTHPVTLIYPLATPVETPLSDAELIGAGNLRTFATVTNTTTEDPVEPEITLEYATDLKTYIDKKLAEISAATLENATNASQ